MNRFALILAAILVLGRVFPAAADNYVVLTADGDVGPRLLQGGLVGVGDRIDLPAGARVVLLSSSGEVVRLHGPVSRQLGPPPRKTWLEQVKLLAALLSRERADQSVSMAVRGWSGSAPPDPWVLDVTSSSAKCTFADRAANLWMPIAKTDRRVSFESTTAGKRAALDWPAGVATLPWPRDVPLADGAVYRVELGRSQVRAFKLFVAPRRLPPGEAALLFAERECVDQLKPLLSHITAGTDPG